jgi:probable phosphoglycerate mutase
MNVTVHIDGGSRGNPGPAAAGVVIRASDGGRALHEAGYFLGRMTNNAAEYHGLLRALALALDLGATQVHVISDSQLMVRQINGQYKVKSPDLRPFYDEARALFARFASWQMVHVLRHLNARADELANRAMDAGRDVIVTSVALPVAPSAPTTTPAPPRWTVRLVQSGKSACPLPPTAGQEYPFGPGTPAGLCVHAAAAALAQGAPPPADGAIACPRCGAQFQVQNQK